MRLFRKSKTVQETPDLAQESLEDYYDHQPSAPAPPPPALQLNFELPLMSPSSLEFGGPMAPENKNKEDTHLLAQMQQQHAEKTYDTLDKQKSFSMTNPNTGIGGGGPANIVPLVQIIGERQNAPSYNFEYPLQMAESSSAVTPSNQNDYVKRQLLEQFGHKLPTSHQESKQSEVTSSSVGFSSVKTTENIFSNFAYSQPPQTSSVQQSNQQIMNVGNTRVDFQQLTGSHTSKEDGSSSGEDDNAKLNNSMAAMSIGDKKMTASGDGGLKMSNRALYIQRMREASALGKVAAFKPQFFEAGRNDEDDESDDLPLGGLRQMRAEHGIGSGTLNGMSTISGGSQSLVSQQQQQHQSHGAGQPSISTHGEAMGYPRHAMYMYAQQAESPHQSAYQQQHMPSTLSASTTPYATSPHVASKGGIQHPVSYTGANTANPMASAVHQQHSMQTSLPPQMRYNREAPGAQSMNMANGMFRSPVAGSSSVTFGNVGLSRAAMAEQSKYMYAPSLLSQMPVYCPPPIMEGHATRTAPMVPPEMRMPHHPAPMAGYMPAPIANGSMRSLPGVQQQPPHIHQQTTPGAASNGQEALMNFIPNHDRYSGTISNNPLMRDLNKLKQFSAKDYSSRPTLLAEVDSRQLAKKSMPGLGGSTCHSFQPEAPPLPMQPPQQQQFPPAGYHSSPPPRPQDRNDHETYYGHPHDQYYNPHRGNPTRRKHAPRQDSEEKGRGYSSSYSDSGNKRRTEPKTDRSRSSGKHRDQERGRDTYGSEYEGRHVREFRQRKPYQRSRGRSSRGRSHHRRYDDKDYDHFDYDDYSDSYASEYYDEWDCDSDDYYDDRVDDTIHHRRRSSKYRSRGNTYREPARAGDGRRRKLRHSDAHDSWHKPHRAPLDDPRDDNRMVPVATKGVVRQGVAMGSEQTIDPHAARQRSQFGRILANIKRGAPVAGALSGKSSAQNSPVPKEHTIDNHVEETPQKKNPEKESCNDNSSPNATEDADAYPEQTAETEVAEEGTAETRSSPSTANCPTPAPVNAAIVAAN